MLVDFRNSHRRNNYTDHTWSSDVWQKLPWFAAFDADKAPRDKPTIYRVGERTFILVFAATR